MRFDQFKTKRGPAVMQLLATHEALSFGALRALLEPPASRKQLERAIARLRDHGYIHQRRFHIGGGSAIYYEVADAYRHSLGVGKVHTSKLDHNDYCAMATEVLRRLFPTAAFVTERRALKIDELKNVLGNPEKAIDSVPDIMMTLPGKQGGKHRYIAIEVERFLKCSERIVRKLTRYGARTKLDGVIYLVPNLSILSSVSARYRALLEHKAARIRHYKDHFLVGGRLPEKQSLKISETWNAGGTPVSIVDWLHKLDALEMSERSDLIFKTEGGRTPSQPEHPDLIKNSEISKTCHHRPPFLTPLYAP